MSADLLAEFGQPQSSSDENGKTVNQPSGIPACDKKNLVADVLDASGAREQSAAGGLWHRDDRGAEVLFDASTDQYDVEDDFGDFEVGQQEPIQDQPNDLLSNPVSKEPSSNHPVHLPDLLDLDGSVGPNEPQNQEDEWGEFTDVSSKVPKYQGHGTLTSDTDHKQASAMGTSEEWEWFKDQQVANPFQPTKNRPAGKTSGRHEEALPSSKQPQDFASPDGAATGSNEETRPSNIPPPAILLQCLPKVFSNIANTGHTAQSRKACSDILQAHTVASRLIAGRSLRWKRDTILNQSTKIGPAVAGRKGGGMKLAAIDKSENLKEEKEVGDVLQAWEKHAYFFNSTVHRAGIQRPLLTLSEKLKSRPAKGAGVLTSKQPCALCGLKRDERVPEADFTVDDSFGEYWSEHWGHLECKRFWYWNQALLPQR